MRLEQLVREADDIDAPSPEMTMFESEKAAVSLGLDRWLHTVEADAFPARAWALRDALFVESLGTLAFRDVVLRYADGHEEHETGVLVTGDPFEHMDRWWKPQRWRRLHEIDEIHGQLRTWLVCAETDPATVPD